VREATSKTNFSVLLLVTFSVYVRETWMWLLSSAGATSVILASPGTGMCTQAEQIPREHEAMCTKISRLPPCFASAAGRAQCVDSHCQWVPAPRPTVPGFHSNWSLWNATVASWHNAYEFSFSTLQDMEWKSLTVVDDQVVDGPSIYRNITIEWVFQRIQRALDKPACRLDMTFSNLGYPTEVSIDWDEMLSLWEDHYFIKSVHPAQDKGIIFGLGTFAVVAVSVGVASVLLLAGLGAWLGYRRARARVARAPDYLADAKMSELPDSEL